MKTEILYLNDKSSSMLKLQMAVIAGFNEFLKDQQEQPGEARLTHVQFATAVDTVCRAVPVGEIKPLDMDSYAPAGSTALYDAIGKTLEEEGKRIAAEQWADQVIVAINTDGEENASRHYQQAQINTMITHAQAHGWKFIFLAANQDAFATGATLGIAPQFTRNYTASAAGMADAYGATSAMVTSLRAAPSMLGVPADVKPDA